MAKVNEWVAIIVAVLFAVIGIIAAVAGNMTSLFWFGIAAIAVVVWPTLGDERV